MSLRVIADNLSNYVMEKYEDQETKQTTRQLKKELTDVGEVVLSQILADPFLTPEAARFLTSNSKDAQRTALAVAAELLASGRVINENLEKTLVSLKQIITKPKSFITDVQRPEDFPSFFGTVIEKTLVKSVQPTLVGINLLQRLDIPSSSVTLANVAITAMGEAARLGPYSIELPTLSFAVGGEVYQDVGAVGIMTKLAEQFTSGDLSIPLFQYLADEAVKAIFRYREREIFNFINALGTTSFDNTSSSYPNTTGRNAGGTANATLGFADIFTMCSQLITAGYVPDVIMFHPLAWTVFAQDPFMQAWGFWNGQLNLFKKHQGDQGDAGMFGRKPNLGTPFTPVNTKTAYTDVPEYNPYTLKVVVSPYLPINTSNSTTTIIVADSNQLGAYVEAQGLKSIGWNDIQYETVTTKWTIKYGLMQISEGKGIRKAVGVKYDTAGYSYGPWNAQYSITSMPEAGTTAIL